MDTSRQIPDEITNKSESMVAAQRQRRSIAEKRRIIEETLVEGASVARVARAHGINANQVFGWRRLYLAGRLGDRKPTMKLLPVHVSESVSKRLPVERNSAEFAKPQPSTIQINLRQAQVRRKFYDLEQAHASPVAREALVRIGALYGIEETIRGKPPDERRAVRQAQSKPLLDSLRQ